MEKKVNDSNSNLTHDWSIHAHLKLTQRFKSELPSHQQHYGFQRGNITFTAQPPQRQDSGLGNSSRGSTCGDCTSNITPQCEVCCGMRSPMSSRRAQSFTAHFCTNVSPKKHLETVDVSSQTSPTTSMVFIKENTKVVLKNQKYELDKHKKRNARTVHIDVYCTESSDSEGTLISKTPNMLLDLSDIKINCKKISNKSYVARNHRKLSNKSMLQRSPCLSAISSTNTISSSSLFESSSCNLSSFINSTTLDNTSVTSSELDSIKHKYQLNNYDDTTSSSDDECSETAWSFNSISSQNNQNVVKHSKTITKNIHEDMGSFSDCSQSPMYKQQLLNSYNVTTQIAKMASKFGPIRSPVKQDHHVGPSKNPDCLCFNCRRHYNTRHRSYSIGSDTDQSEISTLYKNFL